MVGQPIHFLRILIAKIVLDHKFFLIKTDSYILLNVDVYPQNFQNYYFQTNLTRGKTPYFQTVRIKSVTILQFSVSTIAPTEPTPPPTNPSQNHCVL